MRQFQHYDLNLRYLYYFLTIAELGNLTKAAAVLNVTQPMLSQCVRSLEENLRCTLFNRMRYGVLLTEEGAILKDAAERLLGHFDSAVEKISAGADRLSQISVGIYNAINESLLRSVAKQMRNAQTSDGTILALIFNTFLLPNVQKVLLSDDVDLLIFPDYSGTFLYSSEYRTHKLLEFPLVCTMSDQNPLAAKQVVLLEDLRNTEIACLKSDIPYEYENALRNLFSTHNFVPRIRYYENISDIHAATIMSNIVTLAVPRGLSALDGLSVRTVSNITVPLVLVEKRNTSEITCCVELLKSIFKDIPKEE